jgi:selT/selW/selH-like putative selenoprotein
LIRDFSAKNPGVKEAELKSAIFLFSMLERDFAQRYPLCFNPHTQILIKEDEKQKIVAQKDESRQKTKKFFSEDEDEFNSAAVFDASIIFCSGCGYEARAKYVADVINSVYPLAKIYLAKSQQQDGSFEVSISQGEIKTTVHSKLSGDGYITEDNIYEFMLEIEDILISEMEHPSS